MLTLTEAIEARRSVRSFAGATPGADSLPPIPPNETHMALLRPTDLADSRIGTYGIIKGAPAYVAVMYDKTDDADALAAGMAGERFVLECVRRGLGTCWLGGTFNRAKVARSLGASNAARVQAVIAVGEPAAKRSVMERVMRHVAASDKRKPLSQLIIAGDVPAALTKALDAVRLAPSAMNRQPWRFAFNGNGSVDVYADPADSFMALDTGIALCHFLLFAPGYRVEPPRHPHPLLKPLASLIK